MIQGLCVSWAAAYVQPLHIASMPPNCIDYPLGKREALTQAFESFELIWAIMNSLVAISNSNYRHTYNQGANIMHVFGE